MDRKQIKEDYGDEPIAFLNREYDRAILGVTYVSNRNIVCYDVEKCLEVIMERESCDYDQASFTFNSRVERESDNHRLLFINT